jgi:hypothetical protein
MVGESEMADDNVLDMLAVVEMAPHSVDAIIRHEVKNLEQLQKLAPDATAWLKKSLAVAYKDRSYLSSSSFAPPSCFLTHLFKFLVIPLTSSPL